MTKIIIVVDHDIDARNRDLLVVTDTPMDPLDFASPQPALAGKLGIDATVKIGLETTRHWRRPLTMPREVVDRVQRQFGSIHTATVMRWYRSARWHGRAGQIFTAWMFQPSFLR